MYKPIRVEITKEMLEQAMYRDETDPPFQGSITDGEGRLAGYIGELMLAKYRTDFVSKSTRNHDFISKNGTVEVKTKRQYVDYAPLAHYEGSVAIISEHQKPEFYVFCRVHVDKKSDYPNVHYPYGWICGGISREDFFKVCRKLTQSEIDGDNNFEVRADCFNIRYDQTKYFPKK